MTQGPDSLSLRALRSDFVREYGMIFVLLLLCLFFSQRTIEEQHPTGEEAGRQVARMITRQHGDAVGVLIVTRNTTEDRAFADACEETLQTSGAKVLGTVNSSPREARVEIERILSAGGSIDAIAANNATATWTIYDKFEEVGSEKCVTPKSYRWPNFLKISNLTGVANQTAIYAIIAVGMTMVIISKGIDLSVGSLVALASISMAVFVRDFGGGREATLWMLIIGSCIGIGLCAASGAFVGVMVTAFRIPPFIVTLAMLLVAKGFALRWNEGESVNELPSSFTWLGRGDTLNIPNAVWLMAMLYVVAHVVMSKTTFGRHLYAIGGNEEAARLSGIRVKRVLLIVYTICGALAGLGGIVLTSKLGAGDPKIGVMYELDVIAAVVVGGTSLMGGRGRVLGTLIGAFIIAVIKNGMNLTGVEPFNQLIVLGAVLLAAVLIDTLKRRGIKQ